MAASLPSSLAHADNELAKLELSLGDRTSLEMADLVLLSHHEGMEAFAFKRPVRRARSHGGVAGNFRQGAGRGGR